MDKNILKELEEKAIALTEGNVANNKSVTIIKSESSDGVNLFREPAFSGCGSVHFTMPKSEWRLAKSLGFTKSYREYHFGGKYWNGQFGDACRAYSEALTEMTKKYPNSFLSKVNTGSWID